MNASACLSNTSRPQTSHIMVWDTTIDKYYAQVLHFAWQVCWQGVSSGQTSVLLMETKPWSKHKVKSFTKV
jgi:hypothetical protein